MVSLLGEEGEGVLAVVVGGFDAVTVGVVAAVLLRGALVRVTGESTWGGIVVCVYVLDLCLLCCIGSL